MSTRYFANDTAGGSGTSSGTNRSVGQKIVLAAPTVATAGAAWMEGSGNAKLLLYDATGASGGPGALLAQTAGFAVTGSGARVSQGANYITPVSLPAGNYWSVVIFQSGSGADVGFDATGTCILSDSTPPTYASPSNPYGTPDFGPGGLNRKYSIGFIGDPPVAPVNTVAPVMTGTPIEGNVLSVTTGTWTGAPTPTYTYQWQRNCGSGYITIPGAVSSTYTLVAADIGCTVRCNVTATNSAGSASAVSNASATVTPACNSPVNTVAPVVSGTASYGNVLTTTNGTWTGDPSITFTYRWQRNCGSGYVTIVGQTAATYTVTEQDQGCTLRCIVTALNPCNVYVDAASNATSTVPSCKPANTVAPAVTGSTCQGSTLSVTTGTWTSVPGTPSFTYQWQKNCAGSGYVNVVGATANTFTLTAPDVGCTFRCVVTATNVCGVGTPATSNATSAIIGTPTNTVAPVVAGTPFVGHTLVLTSAGTWTSSPTFTYQWKRDGVAIAGQTTTSYVIVEADVGHNLTCTVTGANACSAGVDATSNSIGPVEDNVGAAVRFCQGSLWRFVITDLSTHVLSFLDRLAVSRTAVFTLNAPAVSTGAAPSDAPEVNILHTDGDPFLNQANRLLVGFRQEKVGSGSSAAIRWVPRYGGVILQVEDVGESDNAMTHYTAFDPLKLLFSRPVQTAAGNAVGKNGLSFGDTRIDVIIGTLLNNTIVNDGQVGIDAGALYGGTGFYDGTIEALPQIDINFSQGTSVGDAIKQLTDANLCDIIVEPIWDPRSRPGYVAQLSIYAQAGSTQDDAIFAWDKFSRSLVGISQMVDATELANKVRYFAGAGGIYGEAALETDAASVTKVGEYWTQRFWPGQKILTAVQELAVAALSLQKNGKQTVAISPLAGCTPEPFREYYLGDRVPVYASDRLRKKIPSTTIQYQRIYGIPVNIQDDSTEIIEQMLTSELQ